MVQFYEMKNLCNLTNHHLTNEQVRVIKSMGYEIIEKEDCLDPEILEKLSNIGLGENLHALADRVLAGLEKIQDLKAIHLPIGSPAFMVILLESFEDSIIGNRINEIIFSHTKRLADKSFVFEGFERIIFHGKFYQRREK